MNVLVVTGTSTDVGKTVVTAALAAALSARGLRVAVCKPAQTGVQPGEPGDLAEIDRLSGVGSGIELARYPDPLAPDTAARRSGHPLLALGEVTDAVQAATHEHDVVLVEGAGGLLVRLGAGGFTLAEVARDVEAPVLVVTAAGLGTLNHTALTTEALAHRGVPCAGLVIGSWPGTPDLASACNRDELAGVAGAPLVGAVPAGSGELAPGEFARRASSWFARPWLDGWAGAEPGQPSISARA
ncbi:dethiobiotin synthase [Rhodococcus sp. HNM0569]|uniref:dethiobiotin synthase n=1 Tax=Rhodococcus sp. HNM0569 TaxID=2716340 RepID=UPI00146E6295|nr:dethiobiotin synthase [Rhodococcus sp. HNM0569]NLU82954.1 ATP-dependent dethiobiotin synthetase BioD [Rhodococcus sp. HNM0569]